jgi:hypothetical protein
LQFLFAKQSLSIKGVPRREFGSQDTIAAKKAWLGANCDNSG